MNNLLLTDSYKLTHWKQYPPKTTTIYSYLECRKGAKWPTSVQFGLQYILNKYLAKGITKTDIEEARELYRLHFGNDVMSQDWSKLERKHHGRLPLLICAIPEGTVVPISTPMMTVENTDPEFPWLTNFVESLLVQVWYPITVATNSREIKKLILKALRQSGTPALIDFKLHDFGFRGSTSVESSAIGGAAHLINFMGTDTVPALKLLRDYYRAEMAGFSIPAAEHSTITAWGKDREGAAYRNMLEQYPSGLVAVVSDSYNVYTAAEQLWGTELRDSVLKRDGVLVVRPDSGYPPSVVVRVLEILGDKFGTRQNDKNYRLLNDKVRIIQGDGIDYDMVKTILDTMMAHNWSADNIAFGSGGGLLQKVNRDTQRVAFKCSEAIVDGVVVPVSKSPETDPSKQSKSGRFTVYRPGSNDDLLERVFADGFVLREQTLDEIRLNAQVGDDE